MKRGGYHSVVTNHNRHREIRIHPENQNKKKTMPVNALLLHGYLK